MNTKTAAGIWDATKAFIKSQPKPATAIAGGVVGGTVGGAVTDEKNTGKGVAVGAIAGAAGGWMGGKKLVSTLFKETDNAAAATTTGGAAVSQSAPSVVPPVATKEQRFAQTLANAEQAKAVREKNIPTMDSDIGSGFRKVPNAPSPININLGGQPVATTATKNTVVSKAVLQAPSSTISMETPLIVNKGNAPQSAQKATSKNTKVPNPADESTHLWTPERIDRAYPGAGPKFKKRLMIKEELVNRAHKAGKDTQEYGRLMSRAENVLGRQHMSVQPYKSWKQWEYSPEIKMASMSKTIKELGFGRQLFQSAYQSPRITTGVAGGVIGAVGGGVIAEDTGKGMLVGGIAGATAGAVGGSKLKSLITNKKNPLFGQNIRRDVITSAWSDSRANLTQKAEHLYKSSAYDIRNVIGGRLSSNFSTTDNKGIRRAKSLDKIIGVRDKIDAALEAELKFVNENHSKFNNTQKAQAHFNLKHLNEVKSRLDKSIDQVTTGAGGNTSKATHSPQHKKWLLFGPKEYNKSQESKIRIDNISGEAKKTITPLAKPKGRSKWTLPLAILGLTGVGAGYAYHKMNKKE